MPRPKEKRNPSTDSLNILDSSEPANSNLESLLDEVARLVERGELPNALRLAERARRIVPGNSSCIVLCARLLIQLGFAGQALEYLQDERDPEISVARAEAFCKLGQFVKAANFLERILLLPLKV
jgi:predicted Zn-dependent protease